MLEHFNNTGKDVFNLKDISELIEEFSQRHQEMKKAISDKITFGKYKGKTIQQLLHFDKQYLTWLVKQTFMDEYSALRDNIRTALNIKN